MDMVDLNGMWPTAVVTSDLAGMDTKSEELDESDPVHIASDLYTMGDNLCRAGELGKYELTGECSMQLIRICKTH